MSIKRNVVTRAPGVNFMRSCAGSSLVYDVKMGHERHSMSGGDSKTGDVDAVILAKSNENGETIQEDGKMNIATEWCLRAGYAKAEVVDADEHSNLSCRIKNGKLTVTNPTEQGRSVIELDLQEDTVDLGGTSVDKNGDPIQSVGLYISGEGPTVVTINEDKYSVKRDGFESYSGPIQNQQTWSM